MPAAYVPTAEDVVTVALFLFSVAASPLPDGFVDAACFQIDRSDLWKVASTAKLPMGRNNFNRVVLTIAALGDAVTVDRAVGSNRHFVRFAVPEADEYVWLEEALADLAMDDLPAVTDAAAQRGFTTWDLSPDLVLPYSPGASEDVEPDDASYEDPDALALAVESPTVEGRTCTHCSTEKVITEYPTRYNGRLSSWCTACHAAAARESKARNLSRYSGGDDFSTYADRSWEDVQALMPEKKHCPRCRETLFASAFNFDSYRRDGLSVYCRPCRHNDRVRASQRP